MSTFGDGLFQYGGQAVANNGITGKLFTNAARGRAWFVDANAATNGTGKTPAKAFNTMQKAFDNVASGDIIYFVGKIREQLVTPVNIFDVTVVGCGNRPHHADSTPTGGQYAAATWAAPLSPTAATALCQVLQQGWRFVNILFAGSAGCASLNFVRDTGSGDDERDASHAHVLGCKFAGVASTDTGILFGDAAYTGAYVTNIKIEDCDFQGCAVAVGDLDASGNGAYRQIVGNRFKLNTTDIDIGGHGDLIAHNIMSLAPTGCILTAGGSSGSQVHGNFLPGTYADGALYSSNAADDWNGNFASTGVTAARPA